MSSEGGRRGMMKTCNSFDGKDPQSRPMLPWTEEDVWTYIRKFNVEYCEVYNDRYVNGVFVEGEKRTGCMFCAYGAHLERGENRFSGWLSPTRSFGTTASINWVWVKP